MGALMWTVQDAKNKFSAVVEAALAGQPQEVSPRWSSSRARNIDGFWPGR
ncbi:type II toxin-antitoxin system prevent-host-death family antitoxin [Rhodobacter capsulatus]